ncbi:hypothetical protein [Roseisolibacter agri]|uniref:NfeD-like C-terminal domain-containing protein n=1 Tax=Roseisolibacter agri TaxID=2014610 RepID=A0AA37Q7K3_9BACT|nr:hypothetical protein [Roseisolibacter agri]GLC26122.1 hypothetical protein rosag_26350 [Roseisolibacter agri]
MPLYLACAVFGGLLLVLQLLGGVMGAEAGHHDVGGDHHDGPGLLGHEGLLQLPSLRTVAAALAAFGLAGAGLLAAGAGSGVSLAAAVGTGVAAGVAVAALTRVLLRFESDGVVQLAHAVGLPATVYVAIPAAGGGAGKVQLALQGRIVDCAAVAADPQPLASGQAVVVVDVTDGDTLVVAPDPTAGPAR